MKRLFLSYELSSIMNGLGYKDDTLYYWFPNPNLNTNTFGLVHRDYTVNKHSLPLYALVNDGVFTKTIPAPTYQEAIDWLRENMRIRIDVQTKTSGKSGYNLFMWDKERVCWVHVYYRESKDGNISDGAIVEGSSFLSVMDYYDAFELAMIEALKIAGLLIDGKTICL